MPEAAGCRSRKEDREQEAWERQREQDSERNEQQHVGQRLGLSQGHLRLAERDAPDALAEQLVEGPQGASARVGPEREDRRRPQVDDGRDARQHRRSTAVACHGPHLACTAPTSASASGSM